VRTTGKAYFPSGPLREPAAVKGGAPADGPKKSARTLEGGIVRRQGGFSFRQKEAAKEAASLGAPGVGLQPDTLSSEHHANPIRAGPPAKLPVRLTSRSRLQRPVCVASPKASLAVDEASRTARSALRDAGRWTMSSLEESSRGRDLRMGNFIQITPFMHVDDLARALAFFNDILGFETPNLADVRLRAVRLADARNASGCAEQRLRTAHPP